MYAESALHPEQQQIDAELPDPQPGPQQGARPRGRPFVKGQSGNPAGRPSRARRAAVVAEALIGHMTVPLTKKAISLALDGDRAALRLCLERIIPPRREAPVALDLPPLHSNADLADAIAAVIDAAARGAVTSSQAASMVRVMTSLLEPTPNGWNRLLDSRTEKADE